MSLCCRCGRLWIRRLLLSMFAVFACGDAFADDAVDQMLTNAHRAALDFLAAQERGDPEGMVRAGLLRHPFDETQLSLGDAADGVAAPTGEQMILRAHELAKHDPALLARVEAIAPRVQPPGLAELVENASGVTKGKAPRPVRSAEALPRRSQVAAPASRTVVVPARGQVRLRAAVSLGQSLIVYAHSHGGTPLTLRLVDEATLEHACADSQQHGVVICRYQPATAAHVSAMLENTTDTPTRVLVSTNL